MGNGHTHKYICKRIKNIEGVGPMKGKPLRMAKYICECDEWLKKLIFDENIKIPQEWNFELFHIERRDRE